MDVRTIRNVRKVMGTRSLAALLTLGFLLPSAWAADPKINFNIPAGTFEKTILQFSKQAHIETMYVSSQGTVAAVTTRAVVGRFEPAEALAHMLKGTGVTFEFENSRSVLLRWIRKPVKAAQTRSDEAGPLVAVRHAIESEPEQLVTITGTFIRGLEDITAPLMILGQGATLMLVNGRRQPASGLGAEFVDISTIPWSAVERIDVLADGSSALYGSDAIAGVVNIVMREDLMGTAETQARFGNALGGADERMLSQSFGHRWDGGKWLFTYQYLERTALAAADRDYAANADKRSLGGSDLRSFLSSPGNILNPATRLPMFGLTENGQLSSTINLHNQMAGRDLLPDKATHSGFFKASQDLGERFNLFAEGRYNQRQISATHRAHSRVLAVPASNAFFVDALGDAPFALVAYNFLNELGPFRYAGETTTYVSTLGLNANIADRWQATLAGHYGQERMHWRGHNLADPFAIGAVLADSDPATAFNPFGSGSRANPATLDAIRAVQFERAVSDVEAISLIVDGPLPELPTGIPKFAMGVDQHRESLSRYSAMGRSFSRSAQYARQVSAAFAEVSLPLTPKLNLSLAGRHETHSGFGDTFNPKLGLHWTANDSLRLRGSWGTSFRAPTLVDLYDTALDGAALMPLADPQSSNGFSFVLIEGGHNSNLHEETARTWTAGFDFAPKYRPGLTWTSTCES